MFHWMNHRHRKQCKLEQLVRCKLGQPVPCKLELLVQCKLELLVQCKQVLLGQSMLVLPVECRTQRFRRMQRRPHYRHHCYQSCIQRMSHW